MGSKTICFCIRVRNRKSKENELGDAEKLSEHKTSDHHPKPRKKGKSRGYASACPGDDADGNVPGATTTGGTEAGVTAAVVSAAYMSAVSANEGGSSHGHGGESGGGDGG